MENQVVELVEELSKIGYGKRKSVGRGQFILKEITEFSFDKIATPDGFVALSNFCPAENDPVDGLYKTFVKFGKLGGEFTFQGNPFKKPLLMIKAGSIFKTGSTPREFYGRLIEEEIAPANPEVVHYAYAFSLPIKYPEL